MRHWPIWGISLTSLKDTRVAWDTNRKETYYSLVVKKFHDMSWRRHNGRQKPQIIYARDPDISLSGNSKPQRKNRTRRSKSCIAIWYSRTRYLWRLPLVRRRREGLLVEFTPLTYVAMHELHGRVNSSNQDSLSFNTCEQWKQRLEKYTLREATSTWNGRQGQRKS